jgi:ribosomal protein L1
MLPGRLIQLSGRVCARHLHYIVQRDTDKRVPSNDIFIRTPDTAPVLACHDYQEIERILTSSPPDQLLSGTFVVNAVADGTDKKMRKERGVATFAAKVKDTTVLAVCSADVHGDAYANGATRCVEPGDVDEIKEYVDDYDVVVCTLRALPSLRPLGRVLRTKMPHERRGTVAGTIQSAVRRAQLNMEWEMTDSPNHPSFYNVTVPLIRSDFPINTIRDHVTIMFSEIMNFCPAKSPKNKFIERLELNWGQDPIHVDIREHNDKLKSSEVTVLKKRYSREETWALRESAKNKADYLEDEKAKIGEFLEQRWEDVLKE